MLIAYVRNQHGTASAQLWQTKPNEHSDYWNPRRSGVERIIGGFNGFREVSPRHEHLPIHDLAILYPYIQG
jgi:hypothetical protein